MNTNSDAQPVVLFTGGSASSSLARHLQSCAPTVNIVAAFDNGGSTGRLRKELDMPAMGDLRARLSALSTHSTANTEAIKKLFDVRLSNRKSQQQLRLELTSLIEGRHPDIARISGPIRADLMEALRCGRQALPSTFQLAELSIGNLLLVGRSLRDDGQLGLLHAVEWATGLLGVESRVLPVTLASVHLGARMTSGEWITGQAQLTNEAARHHARVEELRLLPRDDTHALAAQVDPSPGVLNAIRDASVIVFGFGSFFTSILPHLLVDGVADAVCDASCPVVVLCNPTVDRETDSLSVAAILDILLQEMHGSPGAAALPHRTRVLHFAGDPEIALPLGSPTEFRRAGGDIRTLRLGDFEECAVAGSEFICEAAGIPSQHRTRSADAILRVVLIDLDHTLFDYTALRREATRAALSTLSADADPPLALLLGRLRAPLTDLLVALGLPDLRRQWNDPAVYAISVALGGSLCEASLEAFEALESAAQTALGSTQKLGSLSALSELSRAARVVRDSQIVAAFLSTVESLLGQAEAFKAQRLAFEDYVASHAALLPGADEFLSSLRDLGVPVCLVTEGDSAIQLEKARGLRLDEIVDSVVVTDRTMDVRACCLELASFWREQSSFPEEVGRVCDSLGELTIKSRAFYAALLHALVGAGPKALAERICDARFVSEKCWDSLPRYRVAMVGDNYQKDVAAFLESCDCGLAALRVLSGKYADDDPLHSVLEGRGPLPLGYFPSLAGARTALAGWFRESAKAVSWPAPILPTSADIRGCLDVTPSLSQDSVDVLERVARIERELA